MVEKEKNKKTKEKLLYKTTSVMQRYSLPFLTSSPLLSFETTTRDTQARLPSKILGS